MPRIPMKSPEGAVVLATEKGAEALIEKGYELADEPAKKPASKPKPKPKPEGE